jgi:sugar lactone lactonase YvrE
VKLGHTWILVSAGLISCFDSLPPESRVRPIKVIDLSAYSEGIVIDRDSAIFVSIRNPHVVLRLSDGNPPIPWLHLQVPNGHKILPDGTHWIVGEGTLVHVDSDGHILDSVVSSPAGALQRPNDLALDAHGGFYFTEPQTTREDRELRRSKVFYVDQQKRMTLVADSLCYPNGIVVRADGHLLYVDDSCDSRVYGFPIVTPGHLGARQTFAILPDSGKCGLDGMTLDAIGRLYIAHNGCGRIAVLSPGGQLVRRYAAGNRLASNVAFGGEGLRELYISGAPGEKTGPGAIYRLPLGVRGRSSRSLPAR